MEYVPKAAPSASTSFRSIWYLLCIYSFLSAYLWPFPLNYLPITRYLVENLKAVHSQKGGLIVKKISLPFLRAGVKTSGKQAEIMKKRMKKEEKELEERENKPMMKKQSGQVSVVFIHPYVYCTLVCKGQEPVLMEDVNVQM